MLFGFFASSVACQWSLFDFVSVASLAASFPFSFAVEIVTRIPHWLEL